MDELRHRRRTPSGDSPRSLERRGRIAAAAVISVPFVLSAGADSLQNGFGKLYARHLLRKLRVKLRAKHGLMPDAVDVARALAARSFREFDDAATAPLHGFDGAEDYYRRCSSAQFIGGIRVPTLLLHSRDDPFLPGECIPDAAVSANPHVVAAFTDRGGHVGFVSGRSPLSPRYWAEGEAVRFLAG